jgi:hypothetical protein
MNSQAGRRPAGHLIPDAQQWRTMPAQSHFLARLPACAEREYNPPACNIPLRRGFGYEHPYSSPRESLAARCHSECQLVDCASVQIHYTPTHGSWLNQAEIEIRNLLAAVSRQEKNPRSRDPASGNPRPESGYEPRAHQDRLEVRPEKSPSHLRLQKEISCPVRELRHRAGQHADVFPGRVLVA